MLKYNTVQNDIPKNDANQNQPKTFLAGQFNSSTMWLLSILTGNTWEGTMHSIYQTERQNQQEQYPAV